MSDDTECAHARFSDAELARRHAAVHQMMAEDGLDALIVYSTAGGFTEVQYLADFRTAREAYLVFPAEGDPTLLVQYYNHVPYACRRARLADVRWAGPPDLSTLIAHLRERGLGDRRIGLVGALPWQQYGAIRASLPHVELHDATARFQRLRLVKSEEELTFLRAGAALSDRAMEALEREARPGIAEYVLAAI